jgi:hypothetical protein
VYYSEICSIKKYKNNDNGLFKLQIINTLLKT